MHDEDKLMLYEYKELTVSSKMASLYLDAYENFGWEADEKIQYTQVLGKVKLHFRRDRHIPNKTELTRLQRHFDACTEEIQALESSKTSGPKAASIAVSFLGTAFMAGAVFAVTAVQPLIILCILLAVPGIICWTVPYYLFQRMVAYRTKKITPMIETKYDELYTVCEKGRKLLK